MITTRTMMRMKSVNTTEMEMVALCLSFGVELLVSNPVYIDCINIKI